MAKSSITKTAHIDLEDHSGFWCEGCDEHHIFPLYAIAQIASGNGLLFTCENCEQKTELIPA